MKTTVRIALLLALTIATACRFVADKKDDAVRFLAASVLGSVAELQSTTPLEQSSFRNTEPVAPKKESKAPAAPVIRAPKRAEKPVTLVTDRGTVSSRAREGSRRASDVVVVPRDPSLRLGMTPCHSVIVVVPMADTIGS